MFPSRLMLSVINSVCCGQCSLPLGRFILFKLQLNSEKRKLKKLKGFSNSVIFYENHCLIIAFSTRHSRDTQPFLKLGAYMCANMFCIIFSGFKICPSKNSLHAKCGLSFFTTFHFQQNPNIGPHAQIFSIFRGNLANIIVIYQYLSIELQVCAALLSIQAYGFQVVSNNCLCTM